MPEENERGEGLFFVLIWLLFGVYYIVKGFWLEIPRFLAK